MPLSALIVSLPVNRSPMKVAPKVPNKVSGSLSFYSFASLLIVSLTSFTNKPDSSRDLTISIISFISSSEIINVVTPDPNIFLWIAAPVTDAAAISPDCIKLLLGNGSSTFPFKSNPVFSNGLKNIPKNSHDCPILNNRVFDNFILADKPFAKALRTIETCVLVNKIYAKYYFRHWNHQQHLTKSSKLLQYYILFLTLIY